MDSRRKAHFIKSATAPKDYPEPEYPEVALCGRSNAGKSSLLNCLVGTAIAKVSAKPGATRLVNFFQKGTSYRIVDLPGYGFASRSVAEKDQWRKFVEAYLSSRECLAAVILVMDIRRDWQEEEQILLDWLDSLQIPMVIAATKADKISRAEVARRMKTIKKQSGLDLFAVSNLSGEGTEGLEEFVFSSFIK